MLKNASETEKQTNKKQTKTNKKQTNKLQNYPAIPPSLV